MSRVRRKLGSVLAVLALTVGAGSAPGGVGGGAQAAAARPGSGAAGGAGFSPGQVWATDLTPRQGRMVPGDSALPGREPGLSARQAAAIRAAGDPVADVSPLLSASASARSAPAPGSGSVPASAIPTSDGLGLEQFYQYTGTPAGPAGAVVQVNQDNGNAAVALDLLSVPGRGLTSFVRMTYNSQDPTDSPVGPGWTLDPSTITPLGQYLRAVPGPGLPDRHDAGVPIGAGMPSRVMLVDGTGAGQLFTLDRHGSTDPRNWEYHAPHGVHLYLQHTGSQDPARTWVFTRPDRTEFFFGPDGLPTAVADRVGNTSAFQYNAPPFTAGRQLAALIDPAGRRALAFTYLAPGALAQSPDTKLASITDLSGRRVEFAYDARGRLITITQAAGSPVARSFGFSYEPSIAPGGGSAISVITDPLGRATTLQYFGPQTDAMHRGKVSTVTDRNGGSTTFDYAPVPPGSAGVLLSTVTNADHEATRFALDARGRTIRSTDALGGVTDLAWDCDDNLVRLRTPDGAVSTWVYDPLTGDPLNLVDPAANARGATSGTALTYRTSLNGHVADLVQKVSPEGRRWTFAVDAYGQVISATDPVGNTPGPGAGEHSSMRYDRYGELVESTDPDGHVSRFADFTDAGLPQTSIDPLGQVTHTIYDDLGQVVSAVLPPDPGQPARVATTTYDQLGRQLAATTTVSATRTTTVPAPIYDADDDVLRSADADGSVTTAGYGPMGQMLSATTPADSGVPGAPAPTQTFTYDPVGNELTATKPDGNAPGGYGTHTVHAVYDALNRRVQQTDPLGGITTLRYDPVGNLIAQVPPNGNVPGANPAQWTTTFAYDPDGRQIRQTDPAGAHAVTEYDLDGLVTANTGQLVGPTVPDSALHDYLTVTQYDADGRPLSNQVPFRDDAGNLTYHTTAFAYDADGNTIAVTTPRGVAANRPGAFVQRKAYDADNRLVEQDEPDDPSDRVYNTPDKIFYTYDAVGDTLTVSNPPSSGQTRRTVTANTYTANGWLQSTTDPWSITTGYTYDDDGRQLTSTVTDDGSAASRTLSWQYYPDGSLRSRSDTGSPVGKDVVLLDDSDPNTTAASGAWNTSSAGSDYEGFGYQWHAAGTGGDSFTWSALIPQSGNYHIAVRVPSGTGVAGLSPDPKYTIATKAGTSTKQPAAAAGGWADLGTFQLSQNETATITLPEQADGAVIADAVRLVRDDGTPVDPKAKWFDYTYDPDGNATGITDESTNAPVGNYTVAYDQLDRPSSVTPSSGGQPSVTFAYDGDGNVLSQTYGKRSDTFTYDTREQLQRAVSTTGTGAPPISTSYQYDPAGNVQHEVEGNGNTLDATYFLDGSLRQQVEKRSDGTLVSRHDLDYDADSNRITDDSRVMNADDHSAYLTDNATYQYDPRDRLTAVHKTGEPGDNDETYRHDGNGNVIDQSVDGVPTSFTYDRNRLVSSLSQGTRSEYEYDTFGRLSTVTDAGTHKVTAQHEYDGFDRQTSTRTGTGSAASTATFTYDSLDRQVSTTDSTSGSAAKTTTEQYLSLGGAVVAANTAGGADTSYFYSASGARLAQLRAPSGGSAQTSYFGYDAHSDVELLTDEHGNTRSTYGYASYGSDQAAGFTGIDKPGNGSGGSGGSGESGGSGTSGGSGGSGGAQPYNSYRFNAMQVDPASGQYDMGFRDYDPGVNSFDSPDSYQSALSDLGLTADPWASSEYAFGGGNPISDVEFDGHNWFTDAVSAVGSFVAKHAETITSAVVSTAVFVGCEGATAGIGTVGCAAASGAAGALVDQGFQCADKGGSACSVKSFAVAGVKGAVTGALGGAAGEVGGQLLGKIAPKVIDAVTSRGGGEAAEEATSQTTTETAEGAAPKGGGGGEAPHTSRPAAPSGEAPPPEPAPVEGGPAEGGSGEGGSAEGGPSEGASCPNSFAAGTAVLMADGTTKPIHEVRVGDVIEDAAPGADTPQAHTVTALHITHTDRDFVDLIFSAPHGAPGTAHVTEGPRAGGTVTSTAGHLFYDLSDARWTPAAQLEVGDLVQGVGTATATVLALHRHTATITTYNLTVDDEHTYFVVAGDTAVLVHNCDGATINLTYKPGWSPEQIAAADAKVAAYNAEPQLMVSAVTRGSKSAADVWRAAGNSTVSGSDIDHLIDLQLGGSDSVANMWPLDASVNRSLGAQVSAQIRQLGLQPGDLVCSVTIGARC